MSKTLRTETNEGVRSLILCRASDYNTITPELRDELAEAIDEADRDDDVRVILLRAEGPAIVQYLADKKPGVLCGLRARLVDAWTSPAGRRGCIGKAAHLGLGR